MTTVILAHRASVRAHMRQQADNDSLDQWHRLGCLVWVHANEGGHAPMREGQVARELRLTVPQVSEAIKTAKARGWIDPVSTARCLVLDGHAGNPCDERHAA